MQCSVTLNCGHRCMSMCSSSRLACFQTDQIAEICCDDCVCQKCDRRVDCQRSMLKAPKATAASRAVPSNSRGLLLDSGFQRPANPPPSSQSSDRWEAYVNGGAKEDDARMLQMLRQEDAAWEEQRRNDKPRPFTLGAVNLDLKASSKLIETSPQKVLSAAGNAGLLVDLDMNSTHGDYLQQSSQVSYGTTVESRKKCYGSSQFSLLD